MTFEYVNYVETQLKLSLSVLHPTLHDFGLMGVSKFSCASPVNTDLVCNTDEGSIK